MIVFEPGMLRGTRIELWLRYPLVQSSVFAVLQHNLSTKCKAMSALTKRTYIKRDK